MRKRLIAVALLTCCIATPVFASTREELEETRKELEQSQARQAKLEQQSGKLAAELADLQQKMVKLAADIQKNEAALSETEDKLRVLNQQMEEKSAALKVSQKRLGSLIEAALRLSRMPPEAMVMMPGEAGSQMKAAHAVKMAASSIRKEISSVQAQMAELKTIEDKVAAHRDEIVSGQKRLSVEQKKLQANLASRKALQSKLNSRQQEEAKRVADLARKADDLRGLLATLLSPSRQKAGEGEGGTSLPTGSKGKPRSFARAKGHIRPPLPGRLIESFGAPEEHGGTSKGVVLMARENAQVVAPFDGEVVFTGPFLNYGKLVIIRHSDDFHTLLAGLAKIEASPGEFLLEGEPIGAMGSKASGNRLYIELRKSNQPINPAAWIHGLNSHE